MSESQAFAPIANVAFSSSARILSSSWCPDKDLIVVVLRVANKDRLSLWKMQGSKIWEVEVDAEAAEGAGSAETSIAGVAWSPDSEHRAIPRHTWMDVAELNADGRSAYCSSASSTAGNSALYPRWKRRTQTEHTLGRGCP